MKRSDPGIDVHRGLAVVLMFLAHAWRVQARVAAPTGPVATLDATLRFLDRGVAYVAASFLFVAGFSLVLGLAQAGAHDRTAWRNKTLLRAGWLYLLSLGLFVPEFGIELPDMLLSSGILSVICVAITGTALALLTSHPRTWLVAFGGASLAIGFVLERMDLPVSGLNAGPGGAVPLVTFSAAGALVALDYRARGLRAVINAALVLIVPFGLAWLTEQPWLAYYESTYRDHGGLAIASWLAAGAETPAMMKTQFWNPSTVGALGLLAPVCGTTAVLLAVQDRWLRGTWARPLLLLGRHALLVYVSHLLLLGLVDLAGLRPPNAVWTLVLWVALILSCIAMAAGVDWNRRRRKAAVRVPP